MMRRIATKTWLWVTLSGVLFVGHLLSALWTCSGTVMQRAGAALILFGLLIAARPFIRVGARVFIEMSLPRPGVFPLEGGELLRELARPEIEKDVRIQIYGPILVLFGTFLSEYGDLIGDACLKFFGFCACPGVVRSNDPGSPTSQRITFERLTIPTDQPA